MLSRLCVGSWRTRYRGVYEGARLRRRTYTGQQPMAVAGAVMYLQEESRRPAEVLLCLGCRHLVVAVTVPP